MTPADYERRLRIPIVGMDGLLLFTSSGTRVAIGYVRVVIGGRGPYVEFSDSHILQSNLFVPPDQAHRLGNPTFCYDEYRSNDKAFVKFYRQKRTVDYADYMVGLWYASPFELFLDNGTSLIDPLPKSKPVPPDGVESPGFFDDL